MAKQKQLPDDSDDGEMTVVMFKLRGNNTTMQDGIRTFAAALRGIVPTAQPSAVALPSPKAKVNGQQAERPRDQQAQLFDTEGEGEGEAPTDEVLDAEVAEAPVREKPSNGTQRKPPKMSIVPDLDFHPVGKQSLAEFVKEKQPKSQYDQLVVFTYYLCKILELQNVTYNCPGSA